MPLPLAPPISGSVEPEPLLQIPALHPVLCDSGAVKWADRGSFQGPRATVRVGRLRVRLGLQADGSQESGIICVAGALRVGAEGNPLFTTAPPGQQFLSCWGWSCGGSWHGGPHIQSETSGFAA